jgi:uncharacterized circularly permuted ATP-grasp superfamily protein
MLGDAIRFYHDLLHADGLAEEADAALRQRLRERGLYFGDRPLCVVLRPHFYGESHWRFMKSALDVLLTAFQRAHDVCLADPAARARLRLEDYEEQLLRCDPPDIPPWTSSRLDTFYVVEESALKCVEYNAETPAGIGYADVLTEVFMGLEPMKRFTARYPVRALPSLHKLSDALLTAYHRAGGQGMPNVGILDWREVPTISEHHICREHFEQRGMSARLVDPRALEYVNGRLLTEDGFHIQLIYKRVLFSELHGRMGAENPVFRAYRDGRVFITNGISAKLLAKKASLAFLSDERSAHLFSAEQRRAIDAHIPWTRVVEERTTEYKGQTVDLLPFLSQHKDQFVVKPNDEYGGSGVLLGWECSQEVWDAALKAALERPYVAQERVKIVQSAFPAWIGGQLEVTPRYVDADPYVFNGLAVEGCMTRLSSLSLLNVTAGGGSIVPTLLIQGM